MRLPAVRMPAVRVTKRCRYTARRCVDHPRVLSILSTIRQPARGSRPRLFGGIVMTRLSPRLLQATPVTVDHAEGCYIHGTDGRRYLDFTAGIGVTSTGHCHPHVVEAARRRSAR